MLSVCVKSLLNRRFVASLTVLAIALSVALILGVERLRTEARASFANSASGIDLIVAARGNEQPVPGEGAASGIGLLAPARSTLDRLLGLPALGGGQPDTEAAVGGSGEELVLDLEIIVNFLC